MLHQLLEGLLCGEAPDLRDVVLLRSLLMQVCFQCCAVKADGMVSVDISAGLPTGKMRCRCMCVRPASCVGQLTDRGAPSRGGTIPC